MEDRSMALAAVPLREMKWSPAEKAVARRAFDLALNRELEAVVREAKDRAAKITEPSELWELERWLAERRREIDRKYDYRYSILPLVLAALLRTEDDLQKTTCAASGRTSSMLSAARPASVALRPERKALPQPLLNGAWLLLASLL
jgi:hypothetical protein